MASRRRATPGGAALFEAFRGWLDARGAARRNRCPLEDFQRLAAEFFREAGWGSLTVGIAARRRRDARLAGLGRGVPRRGDGVPVLPPSAGMFADFFGRVADAPLAVMEVECRSTGAERCRFLLGSAEVMQAVYEGMSQGQPYDEAVAATA